MSKRQMFKDQHSFCWLCGTRMILKFENGNRFCATYDHIIPVANGGTWDPQNLKLAHQDCNNRRGNDESIICLPPPKPRPVFSFRPTAQCYARQRGEIRPERPTGEVPWSRQWMIDKGLMHD